MEMHVMQRLMNDLQTGINAVCPNTGVYIGTPENKATWGFHPNNATPEQIAAGQAVIDGITLADYTSGSIKAVEDCYKARKAAYPPSGDQLDALMKGLDAVSAEITLPADTLAWIAACKAVKTQYPKE